MNETAQLYKQPQLLKFEHQEYFLLNITKYRIYHAISGQQSQAYTHIQTTRKSTHNTYTHSQIHAKIELHGANVITVIKKKKKKALKTKIKSSNHQLTSYKKVHNTYIRTKECKKRKTITCQIFFEKKASKHYSKKNFL